MNASGESSCPRIADSRTPKPATVSMGPTALSGRRRHATRPQAAKDTPERSWSTSFAGTGGPRPNSAGICATKPAAATEIHSASQNHRLCVGAVNRPSPLTRARAVGRARSSPAATAEGIKRNMRQSRL